MKTKSCYACGQSIPQLTLDNGKFNFRCTKCSCETKPQESFESALYLWNNGIIYPFDENVYWDLILGDKA